MQTGGVKIAKHILYELKLSDKLANPNIRKVQESMQGAFLWVNHSAFLMPPRISAMISLFFYLVHLILRLGADLVLLL